MATPRILLPFLLSTLAAPALAHGGQYRGPGNVVPQPASSGSSQTSGSGNNNGSAASGQSAGVAGTPASTPTNATASGAVGAARGMTPRGMQLDEDLGRWEFWWEFGKDPFLRLREAVHGGNVSEDQLLDRRVGAARFVAQRPTATDLDAVCSALEQRLTEDPDRDTASACMVALAKIGGARRNKSLLPLVTPHLRGKDQELRETAALALGIHGGDDADALAALIGLAQDGARGRKLSGDVAVNERTRAFAIYALGLLRARATDPKRLVEIDEPMHAVLADPAAHSRDVKVAAVEALGLPPRGDGSAEFRLVVERAVSALGGYYRAELGPGEHLLQAHVPPALARLLRANRLALDFWRDRFAADLRASLAGAPEPARASSAYVAQSCALALGDLSEPWNDALAPEAATAELLVACYRDHKDRQARSFALTAIARMGGDEARDLLLKELAVAGKSIERPWVAMALGVWSARRDAKDGDAAGAADQDVRTALRAAFGEAKNPNAAAALGIALGLAGDKDQDGPALQQALADRRNQDDAAGYLALALGLLRDRATIGDVRDLLRASSRRPFVMLQCSRALGLIGDQGVTELLCRELQDPEAGLFRLSAAAAAIGQLGDRRSLEPLLALLRDAKQTGLTRAFAAVALGSVCDKEMLPWNSAYATQTNYRAAVDTLTDGARGILDIL